MYRRVCIIFIKIIEKNLWHKRLLETYNLNVLPPHDHIQLQIPPVFKAGFWNIKNA